MLVACSKKSHAEHFCRSRLQVNFCRMSWLFLQQTLVILSEYEREKKILYSCPKAVKAISTNHYLELVCHSKKAVLFSTFAENIIVEGAFKILESICINSKLVFFPKLFSTTFFSLLRSIKNQSNSSNLYPSPSKEKEPKNKPFKLSKLESSTEQKLWISQSRKSKIFPTWLCWA